MGRPQRALPPSLDPAMTRRRLRPAALGAALLLGASAASATLAPPAAVPADLELGKSEHRKLAKAIAEYFEALKEDKKVLEARGDLEDEVEKIEKKAEKPVLAMVDDLEQILLQAASGSDRVTGKGRVDELEVGRGITAMVHAPKGYRFKDGPYPLVLAVHDEGQDPADYLREEWLATPAAAEAVIVAVQMPESLDTWLADVNQPGGPRYLMFSMGSALQEYSIDTNRVYLAGKGAGVAVAAEVASLFPDRFAAVAGRAGDISGTPASNFGTVASLWVGGSGGVDAFAAAARELGRENVRTEAELAPDEMWTWLAEQRRTANPTVIEFAPRTDFTTDAFWVRAEGVDTSVEGTGFKASADRESNTITIEASGMTRVTLFFNDRLVDLDKPVRVVLNGVETETQLERRLDLMLERVRLSGDPGRIYTATRAYDIPEVE